MCCGGGGVRKLQVQRASRPKVEKQKINTSQMQKYSMQQERPKKISALHRQSLVRGDKCPKCRNTIMLVNIAGRERKQCTNITCKHIIR